MEPDTVGRVVTEATVENIEDLWAVKRGFQSPDQSRVITIPDALVDTGATLLSLPTALIERLGLARVSTKRVTSTWISSSIRGVDPSSVTRLTVANTWSSSIEGRAYP